MNLEYLEFDYTKIDRRWIAGITEFCGEFIVRCSIDNIENVDNYKEFVDSLEFYYVVTFPARDIQTAYKFKTLFKCGRVLSDDKKCYFFVTNLKHHYLRIVKFFDGTSLLSRNKIDYMRYRYPIFKIYNKDVNNKNYEYLYKYIKRYAVMNSDNLEDIFRIDNDRKLLSTKRKVMFNIYFCLVLALVWLSTQEQVKN